MKKTWESLPPYAKGIIAVAGTAIAVGAIYVSYEAIKTYVANRNSNKEVSELTNKLTQLGQQGIHPTISQQQADSLANGLEAAFQGYGSDFDVVKRSFNQIKNDADMVIILKSYGTRTISSGTWNPQSDFTGTLSATIADELSSGQVDELNTILQRSGITQKF